MAHFIYATDIPLNCDETNTRHSVVRFLCLKNDAMSAEPFTCLCTVYMIL